MQVFLHPIETPALNELLPQAIGNGEKLAHVPQGVFDLAPGERAFRPIGHRFLFRMADAELPGEKICVADAVAVAAERGRHLRIEDVARDAAGEVVGNLKVLLSGMHDDFDVRIDDQIPERAQVPEREWIERGDETGQRDLHEAKARPVGAVLDEFRIPSKTPHAAELRADFHEAGTIIDDQESFRIGDGKRTSSTPY